MGGEQFEGGDPCFGAGVEQVTIESVSPQSVSFSTRSASLTGDPHECLLRTYKVSRVDVYEDPVAGAQHQVELASGATGTLFLSRAGWEATSDGYKIHGNE